MSWFSHFEEALDHYNSEQAFVIWVNDELMIHPELSLEDFKRLPGVEP